MIHEGLSEAGYRGLKVLRKRIAKAKIPSSSLDESINIAAWNIRALGDGTRTDEAIHYIAEILNQFDLIILTELKNNLDDLWRVKKLLGPYWKAFYSDYGNDSGANRERIAFLYDKRACVPTGLVAEADPYRNKDPETGDYLAEVDWYRAPYMASFRAGSFDFVVLSVHIRDGGTIKSRRRELELLANWVHDRKNATQVIDRDWIVVGDFNVPSTRSSTYKSLTSKGLEVPKHLRRNCESNLERDKIFDLILHDVQHPELFSNKGGVIDFYDGDHTKLEPFANLSRDDFTFQMSDHLPIWTQLIIDDETVRLDRALGD